MPDEATPLRYTVSMHIVAYVLIAAALLGASYEGWVALRAAAHRDEQEADANDIVIAVAVAGWCVCLGLAAVVFAAIS